MRGELNPDTQFVIKFHYFKILIQFPMFSAASYVFAMFSSFAYKLCSMTYLQIMRILTNDTSVVNKDWTAQETTLLIELNTTAP